MLVSSLASATAVAKMTASSIAATAPLPACSGGEPWPSPEPDTSSLSSASLAWSALAADFSEYRYAPSSALSAKARTCSSGWPATTEETARSPGCSSRPSSPPARRSALAERSPTPRNTTRTVA